MTKNSATSAATNEVYQPLRDSIAQCCSHWPSDFPEQFLAGVSHSGDNWISLRNTLSPRQQHCAGIASRILGKLVTTEPVCAPVLDALIDRQASLFWEQSYTRDDGVVSDAMLDGYAFAEVAGQCGPLFSDQIRMGFGLWDSYLHYPEHKHQAEEVYCVLAGSATFSVGTRTQAASAGQAVYVAHNEPHFFATRSSPLLVLYLWQGGDLRQKSVF